MRFLFKMTNETQNTNEETIKQQQQEILSKLQHYTGTEHFYKDMFGCVYTDGFKEFLKLCSCEWLLTDMICIVIKRCLNKEDFILCRIEKDELKNSCDVFLYSDYDSKNKNFNEQHLLYKQHYDYTDFPLKEFEFYICYNELNTFTFLLKNEY